MKRTAAGDLTRGPLARQILLFSLPLIASNLLQVLFNMADVAVVGRFAGSLALGSVGSTTILVGLFTGFVIGLGCGVNVLCARCIGAGDRDGLRTAVHTGALLCLLSGALLSVFGILFCPFVLRLMRTRPELLPGASLYVRLYLTGLPGLALYNYGSGVFSAAGDTRTPLICLSLSGVVNVVLNLAFVLLLRLGVAGVAIASAISQILSAALVLRALTRAVAPHRLSLRRLSFDRACAGRILAVGVPTGVQYGIFAVANLFIQASVNGFPTEMVSGNAAAANADSLVYDVMAAFYTACTTFMSQNYGAGNRRRMTDAYRLTLLFSFLAGAIPGLLLFRFGPAFLALFTADPAVAACGMRRLSIMGLSYAFSAFMDNTIAASRSLGKTAVPTLLEVLGSCLFRILWIFTVFRHFHTIESLYLLYFFSWMLTAAAEIAYFLRIFRRHAPPPAA